MCTKIDVIRIFTSKWEGNNRGDQSIRDGNQRKGNKKINFTGFPTPTLHFGPAIRIFLSLTHVNILRSLRTGKLPNVENYPALEQQGCLDHTHDVFRVETLPEMSVPGNSRRRTKNRWPRPALIGSEVKAHWAITHKVAWAGHCGCVLDRNPIAHQSVVQHSILDCMCL